MFKLLSLIITLGFIFVGVTLGVLNPAKVVLDLYFLQLELPLSVIMAVLFIFGMLLGALFIFMQVMRLNWVIRRKTKENQKLSNQIIQLKKAQVEQSADRMVQRNDESLNSAPNALPYHSQN